MAAPAVSSLVWAMLTLGPLLIAFVIHWRTRAVAHGARSAATIAGLTGIVVGVRPHLRVRAANGEILRARAATGSRRPARGSRVVIVDVDHSFALVVEAP